MKAVIVRLTDEEHKAFRQRCLDMGLTMSDILRAAATDVSPERGKALVAMKGRRFVAGPDHPDARKPARNAAVKTIRDIIRERGG